METISEQGRSSRPLDNVVGSGDFVAVMAKAESAGVDIAVIDLFRVAAGRIVEHRDVCEQITPEATWVNSGKF